VRDKHHGRCPICNQKYNEKRFKTGHHVFPKFWFKGKGPKVPVCRKCHDDFNAMNPMGKTVWTLYQCLMRWNKFCTTKKKDMLVIYPELQFYCDELHIEEL